MLTFAKAALLRHVTAIIPNKNCKALIEEPAKKKAIESFTKASICFSKVWPGLLNMRKQVLHLAKTPIQQQ